MKKQQFLSHPSSMITKVVISSVRVTVLMLDVVESHTGHSELQSRKLLDLDSE